MKINVIKKNQISSIKKLMSVSLDSSMPGFLMIPRLKVKPYLSLLYNNLKKV